MFTFKEKALPLLLSACLIAGPCFLLTACTKSGNADNASVQTSSQSQNSSAQGGNQGGSRRNGMQRPDIFGKVKSIIGNEVVLELAEMPQRPQGSGQRGNNGNSNSGSQGWSGNTGGQRQQGTGAGQGLQGNGSGQSSQWNRTIKFTGKTKDLIIPVGVPITTMGQGGAKQIDIGEIYEGDMLMLWLDKNDKTTVVRVMVMPQRSSTNG